MRSLDATFGRLRDRLRSIDRMSPTHTDPFFHFVHAPQDTATVMSSLRRWKATLEQDRWKVRVVSLAEEMWKVIDASGRWDAWVEVESDSEPAEAIQAVRDVLRTKENQGQKPERHAYVLCDDETACWMRREAWAVGFYVWPSLTWIKTQDEGERVRIGMGYHYRQASERIVFLEKRSGRRPANVGDGIEAVPSPWGKGRQLADLSIPNVIPGLLDPELYPDAAAYDAVRGRDAYPTEKPVALLDTLIRQSTLPGEIVVDPCCGSGSTGVAAVLAGRRAILGDIKRTAAENAAKRIREVSSGQH